MKVMRIYHPDHRVSWVDRIWDLFGGHVLRARPAGVDYTLVNRAAARNVRDFLDGTLNMSLIGDEMVRVDSSLRLPDRGEARRAACEAMVTRLRFGQVHPGGVRVQMPARWFQFDDAPHGTRLLVRLLEIPNPGLRSFLAGNMDEFGGEDWQEYAIGGD